MKKTLIWLIGIVVSMSPFRAIAQSQVMSAFDAIIKCPQAEITENHSIDRDPGMKTKTGQCDVYYFVLPESKANLVKKVEDAFIKDRDNAYSFRNGVASAKSQVTSLAIGDGTESVELSEVGDHYTYATFLAPRRENPRNNYRYAYGISYNQSNGKIKGRLVVTYATTLKYRQQMAQPGRVIYPALNNGWFETFMTHVQSMSNAVPNTRIKLATKMYQMIKKSSEYKDFTQTDKNAAREVLKAMISDKRYTDPVLNQLLVQCLNGLQ